MICAQPDIPDIAFPTPSKLLGNAPSPFFVMHPLIKPFYLRQQLSLITLKLSARFSAQKIFHLTLSLPPSLFSFHELNISRGKFWDAVSHFFRFAQAAAVACLFKCSTSCFRSAQDGREAVERCKGNCTGEVCAAVASWAGFLNYSEEASWAGGHKIVRKSFPKKSVEQVAPCSQLSRVFCFLTQMIRWRWFWEKIAISKVVELQTIVDSMVAAADRRGNHLLNPIRSGGL